MATHGWDQNGFDYLIVNDEGHSTVAGRILPMRPNSTTFCWYVFSNARYPGASGAEPTHAAARLAVEQVIQNRTVTMLHQPARSSPHAS